jgi:hypothetical protein
MRKVPTRFKLVGRVPCPACRDRGALNTWDRPVWHRRQKLTWGCEVCDGEGEVLAATRHGDWPPGDLWIVRTDRAEALGGW